MARISIEDCWWSDIRRSALISLTGGEMQADYAAIRAWRLAQDYWKKNEGLVPKSAFDLIPGSQFLLQVGLAEVREMAVYIKGSATCFEWIKALREKCKKAGQRSAERSRDEKGRLLPNQNVTDDENRIVDHDPTRVQQSSNKAPTKLQQSSNKVQRSYSYSYFNTKNQKNAPRGQAPLGDNLDQSIESGNQGVGTDPNERLEAVSPGRVFVGIYVKAFQKKHGAGTRPNLTGKVQGQIKRFLADYPLERACNLIEVYFQMADPWFEKKYYDFGTFIENLDKVGVALDTGVALDASPQIDWGKVFKNKGGIA